MRIDETELGDIGLVAVARAIHMDILIFNTNAEISISPIETVNADEYEGGYRTNINPIILAYNGPHYTSLDPLSPDDGKKTIELVNLVKTNGYTLKKQNISNMARISQCKKTKICTTTEPESKAKVQRGKYNKLINTFKCKTYDIQNTAHPIGTHTGLLHNM